MLTHLGSSNDDMWKDKNEEYWIQRNEFTIRVQLYYEIVYILCITFYFYYSFNGQYDGEVGVEEDGYAIEITSWGWDLLGEVKYQLFVLFWWKR